LKTSLDLEDGNRDEQDNRQSVVGWILDGGRDRDVRNAVAGG
jgi:hypothetical protein